MMTSRHDGQSVAAEQQCRQQHRGQRQLQHRDARHARRHRDGRDQRQARKVGQGDATGRAEEECRERRSVAAAGADCRGLPRRVSSWGGAPVRVGRGGGPRRALVVRRGLRHRRLRRAGVGLRPVGFRNQRRTSDCSSQNSGPRCARRRTNGHHPVLRPSVNRHHRGRASPRNRWPRGRRGEARRREG
jgi:hypothetical protein